MPHPFASFLRIIGRGPHLSRPMIREEAREAMGMVLAGEVEPEQLGAFLLLLRHRTETPAELAGFVEAARDRLFDAPPCEVDLDWPSYADRHRQLPWFVLSALLLAGAGMRVLMHGIEGEGPASTPAALAALGLRPAACVGEAAEQLRRFRFAYLPLAVLLPELDRLFALRPLFGLRTPVHTVARALNPFRAPLHIQGVFHPGYRMLHRDAQMLLGQPRAVVFKGGGGEAQRNPDKPCRTLVIDDGKPREESWPAMHSGDPHPWRQEELDCRKLADLWAGSRSDPLPEMAVTGTAALVLRRAGRATDPQQAQRMAEGLWARRHELPAPIAA